MSHDLMNGNACLVIGQSAWHGRGVRLDIPPCTEDAVRLASLDWLVSKEPVFAHVQGAGDHSEFEIETDAYATVRFDATGKPHVLGVVGKKYTVLQNREAFEVFDKVLLDRGCTYESAGAVRDGKRVWILARIPDSLQVAGDQVNRFFLLILSHDGSLPLILKPTPIRVVCNNTLNIALKDRSNQFAVKHLRSIRDRLTEITRAVADAEMNFEKAREHMQRMAEYKLHDPAQYFFSVMPELRRWNDSGLQRNTWRGRFLRLVDLHHCGRGNHGQTLWDAYNALVEWSDHDRNPKDWVEFSQFGGGDQLKRRAFEHAVQLVEAVPRPKISIPKFIMN
jgi:phage/plasmid-like protein (TIGR03299 family)